ncbi:E3 ubiquitin-protein ligase RNF115-like [Paramacrobiotus metropolitanus]|uniref:E3 ubiquitin-protein ligase RNF115-like n=1 Tax=Paramacrobiotus metropolitanus TaxID=2943436 RepID=UPI002445F800|nr:E3 ubiquitin-protein ligase RNF115-like [Paramacrobiotus metropolitanus]
MQAFREEQVRRFIEAFKERAQTAGEEEHVQANGIPLTTAEMHRLTELTQVKVTEESDDICPTCQQTFVVDEMKIVLPCSHVGHSACLTTWLTMYSRNCPVCRQPVSTEYTSEPDASYYF